MRSVSRKIGLGALALRYFHTPLGWLRTCVREGGPFEQRRTAEGRAAMEVAAWALPLPAAGTGAPLPVHLLTGARFWYQTAFCLWSLGQQAGRPLAPVIYDDGTLSAEFQSPLRRLFPATRFVTQAETLGRLDAQLPAARYPVLRERWLNYPNIRKLTDPHLGATGWKLVIDSDLLFFRRPGFMLDWCASPDRPFHAVDCEESYGYSRSLMEKLAGAPIPPLVNVGLCGLRSESLNWPELEAWCAELIAREKTSYYLEQALVAMLVARTQPCAVAPAADYVTLPGLPEARDCQAVMHHYVAQSKRWYFQHNWRTALGRACAPVIAPMAPTTLYFELETCDRYHRADWENRLAGWFAGGAPALVRATRADEAEFVIEPQSWHSFLGGRTFGINPSSHYARRPEATFAWDSGDFPTGRLPGLFTSLSRRLFDPARHRSFCYPLRINPQITEYPLADARYLFGFSGNITAPIRSRLLTGLRPAADAGLGLLRQTASVFTRIYNPEADGERARFADDMRQCRFILCPRGNGLSSVRLFETMEAARVPVIISDALVLPQCINWAECAVVVPEADIARVPELLTARADDWPRLAANARREWARCFAPATLLPTLVTQLRDLVRLRRRPEGRQKYFFPFRVLPDYALVQAKRARRALHNVRHPVS